MSSGRSLVTLAQHLEKVNTLAWSPDGARLAICGENKTTNLDSARVWEPASGRDIATIATLAGYGKHISDISWSSDGRRLVGYMFKRPVMWDAENGQEIGNFYSIPGTWSPGGGRLVVIDDKAATIWGEE